MDFEAVETSAGQSGRAKGLHFLEGLEEHLDLFGVALADDTVAERGVMDPSIPFELRDGAISDGVDWSSSGNPLESNTIDHEIAERPTVTATLSVLTRIALARSPSSNAPDGDSEFLRNLAIPLEKGGGDRGNGCRTTSHLRTGDPDVKVVGITLHHLYEGSIDVGLIDLSDILGRIDHIISLRGGGIVGISLS
jgi:hypothetical protein